MPSPHATALAQLFRHRWAAPVLVALDQAQGAKFVTLASRLEVSRDSLRRTLDALVEAGWVMPNPGYGHPMRPEYVLTRDGKRLAPWCARVLKTLESLGGEGVWLRKWSLAVAAALGSGELRFSELAAALPGVTARALTQTLKALEDTGGVERRVVPGYPPWVGYRLSDRAETLVAVLKRPPL